MSRANGGGNGTDQVLVVHHLLDGEGKGDGDGEREALGHGDDEDGDADDEDAQVFEVVDRVVPRLDREGGGVNPPSTRNTASHKFRFKFHAFQLQSHEIFKIHGARACPQANTRMRTSLQHSWFMKPMAKRKRRMATVRIPAAPPALVMRSVMSLSFPSSTLTSSSPPFIFSSIRPC
jgi:hypothetical protein